MATVAIIGHGPSPAGAGWGSRIDACDLVIRMWNCNWQEEEDYGRRYDIGVVTLSERGMGTFARLNRRRPASWWGYDLWQRGAETLDGLPVQAIDPRPYLEQAVAMGAHVGRRLKLTRGTAAACHAITTLGADTLVLVGFDGVCDGTMTGEHYPHAAMADFTARTGRTKHRPTRGPRDDWHDFEAERALLVLLASRHGVRLVDPREGWPC